MSFYTLITGAASGIGRACAQNLAGAGHRLVLIDTDAQGLDSLRAELGVSHSAAAMDVADEAAWARLDLGAAPLTGAVICAGVSDAGLITDMDFTAWRRVLSINLDGAFLALQAVLQNSAEGGSVVAVSSASAHKAAKMTAAYGASKAGLSQLVKVAALEGAARKIRVNAIAPGGVKTPMFSDQDFFEELVAAHSGAEGAWAALGASVPLGRYGEPEEIARMIGFLLGPDSATMTGAILNCDGGYGL